ncbi:Trefoil factor 3 [Quaeritorhiza haematococci]|nr:Trefoil factor 3 [Quaeritorhiza haematococci]
MSDRERSSSPPSANGEDVFEIEEILDWRVRDGKDQFLIKWKNFPPEENTWEERANIFADHIIERFWEEKRQQLEKREMQKKQRAGTKRKAGSAKSQKGGASIEPVKSAKAPASSSQKPPDAKRPKLDAMNIEDDDSEFVYEPEATLPRNIMSLPVWEDMIQSVDTVEEGPKKHTRDGEERTFVIFVSWKDGRRTMHDSIIASKKFPQKLIQFYQKHLRFKKIHSDEDE